MTKTNTDEGKQEPAERTSFTDDLRPGQAGQSRGQERDDQEVSARR